MPIQSAKLVKKIAFALRARGGNTKKRLSMTLSRIPFRRPTQFQLSNPLRQPRTTTENVRSSTEAMSAIPPKADIAGRRLDVRFVPKADMGRVSSSRRPAAAFQDQERRSLGGASRVP